MPQRDVQFRLWEILPYSIRLLVLCTDKLACILLCLCLSVYPRYGFYGAGSGTEGSSESLMVNDPNEAFIFHILPDDSGKSAIWVAARVPDDEVGPCL